jgi:hypothetical protein
MAQLPQTLEMRVLQRAVEKLGSERALARRLRVPMPDLFAWLKGSDRPPRVLFLEAVDILVECGDLPALDPAPAAERGDSDKKSAA